MPFQCSLCTYLNNDAMPHCEQCMTPRGDAATIEEEEGVDFLSVQEVAAQVGDVNQPKQPVTQVPADAPPRYDSLPEAQEDGKESKAVAEWTEEEVNAWMSSLKYASRLSMPDFEWCDGATLVSYTTTNLEDGMKALSKVNVPDNLQQRFITDIKAKITKNKSQAAPSTTTSRMQRSHNTPISPIMTDYMTPAQRQWQEQAANADMAPLPQSGLISPTLGRQPSSSDALLSEEVKRQGIVTDGKCPVCDLPSGPDVVLMTLSAGCNHRICMECLRQYANYSIDNKDLCPCPGTGEVDDSCPNKVKSDDVFVAFQDEYKVAEAKSRAYGLIEVAAVIVPNSYHCRTPDCNNSVEVMEDGLNDEMRIMQWHCSECGANRCVRCDVDFHEGQSCTEYKAAEAKKVVDDQNRIDEEKNKDFIQEQLREGKMQLCGECKNPCERVSGCAHMTCGHCNGHFCWFCGRKGHNNFPGDTRSPDTCTCTPSNTVTTYSGDNVDCPYIYHHTGPCASLQRNR